VPRLYTADDLQYAATVETAATGMPVYHPAGGPSFPAAPLRPELVVNPRYALDWPTSIGAVRLARRFGWDNVIGAILATRILAGALGIAFFCATVLLLTRRVSIAVVVGAFLAVSLVYWTYSSHVDESIGMVAFTSAAVFFLARRFVRGSSRWDVLVPVLLGVASLYNFTAVITAVAMAYAFVLTSPPGSSRTGAAARFGAVYAGTALAGVVAAIAVAGDASQVLHITYWKSALFVGHPEYGFNVFHDAFATASDFLRGLVAYPPVRGTATLRQYFEHAHWGQRLAALVFYGVFALVAIAPLVVLVRHRARLGPLRGPALFALAWFGCALLFAWWWDPSYVKYFVLPVLSWALLSGLSLAVLCSGESRWFRPAMTLAAIVVVGALALNLSTIFWPQSRDPNELRRIARQLRASSPNALFVSAGQQPLDFYIPYFARRDVVSLGLATYAANPRRAAGVVTEHIEQHLHDGGPIYVYGLNTLSRSKRETVLSLLPGKPRRAQWRFPGVTVYRVR
jgi:hypothetical protein